MLLKTNCIDTEFLLPVMTVMSLYNISERNQDHQRPGKSQHYMKGKDKINVKLNKMIYSIYCCYIKLRMEMGNVSAIDLQCSEKFPHTEASFSWPIKKYYILVQ